MVETCDYRACTSTRNLRLVRFTGPLQPFPRVYCPRHAIGWHGATVEALPERVAPWLRAA